MAADIDYGPTGDAAPPRLPREGYPQATTHVVWNVMESAPVGWKSVRLEYREVGRFHEAEAEVEMLDGSRAPWDLPDSLKAAIRGLRLRQSSPAGTWHRLSLTVEFPMVVAEVEFDWYGPPGFRQLCPAAEYRRELFNRYQAPEWIPSWLTARTLMPKNKMSAYTWAPAEGVVPDPAPAPPVQVSAPVPDGLLAALRPLLPEGWASVSYEALVIGGFQEHQLLVTDGDGTRHAPEVALELIEAVAAQRAADHTRERGAWLGLTLELRDDGASSMLLDYSTRPMLHEVPPEDVYAEELWHFPRAEEAIPDWLWWRAGLDPKPQTTEPVPAPEPRLKRALETETMLAQRKLYKPMEPAEIERVAAYLRGGAAVLTTAARARDLLFPDRSDHVPLGYRTDGTWIWAEDTVYYLEQDQATPDRPLLKHIREHDFAVPEVSPELLTAAYAELTDWIEGPYWH